MWAVSDILARADFAIREGNRDLAFHLYSMIVGQYPNQAEAFYRLSILEIERRSFQDAYMHANLAVQLEPNNPRFKAQKERVIFELARLGDAVESNSRASTFYGGGMETADGFLDVDSVELPGGLPQRPIIGRQQVFGLGVEPEQYDTAIKNFLDQNPDYGDVCAFCILSKNSIRLAESIRDRISDTVKILFIDEANWSFDLAQSVLRLEELIRLGTKAIFVHLEPEQDAFQTVAYVSIQSQVLISGKSGALVILNRSFERRELSDFVNPNACLFVAGPYSGTERFVNGFYYLARKAGRPERERPRASLRRMKITNDLPADQIPYTPYPKSWASPAVVLQTEAYLRDLEFFETGMLREIYPVPFLEAVPYLDVVGIIRDPRDVVVSYAFAAIKMYTHLFPQTDGAVDAETLAQAAESFIEQNLADICDYFVRMTRSERCFTVRFEDLQDDAMMVFARVVKWLNWGHRYRMDDLAHAAYLGTFFHQSGGTRRRGDGKAISQGSSSHLRSGTSRNWEKLPKATKDRIKEIGGAQLIELGYAQDLDW